MAKQRPKDKQLHKTVYDTVRIHAGYAVVYAVSIVIFDAWNLITPGSVQQRWVAAGILLVVSSFAWYYLSSRKQADLMMRLSIYALVVADLIVASVTVYGERGMASPAVMLFAIPIIATAALLHRGAVFVTASICTAVYSTTIVRYFVTHGSEGFKVQLYGTLFLYVSVFFIVALMLSTILGTKSKN